MWPPQDLHLGVTTQLSVFLDAKQVGGFRSLKRSLYSIVCGFQVRMAGLTGTSNQVVAEEFPTANWSSFKGKSRSLQPWNKICDFASSTQHTQQVPPKTSPTHILRQFLRNFDSALLSRIAGNQNRRVSSLRLFEQQKLQENGNETPARPRCNLLVYSLPVRKLKTFYWCHAVCLECGWEHWNRFKGHRAVKLMYTRSWISYRQSYFGDAPAGSSGSIDLQNSWTRMPVQSSCCWGGE